MSSLDVVPVQVDHGKAPSGFYFWFRTTLLVSLYEGLSLGIQVRKVCLVKVDFELLVWDLDRSELRVTEMNESTIVFLVFLVGGL